MSVKLSNEVSIRQEKDIPKLLEELKGKLKENEDFRQFQTFLDDFILEQFVRGKKYDIDKACEYVLNYLHVRTKRFADFSLTLLPRNVPLVKLGMLQLLKHRDQYGRLIVLNRVRVWDVSKFDADDGIRAWVLLADEALRTMRAACDEGVVTIMDFGNYSFSQARLLTPNAVIKAVKMIVHCMPMRFGNVHFVNPGSLVVMLVTAVKPFLKPKLRNRIAIHSRLETLKEYFMPDILPRDYGGCLSEDEAFDKDIEDRLYSRDGLYEEFSEKIRCRSRSRK